MPPAKTARHTEARLTCGCRSIVSWWPCTEVQPCWKALSLEAHSVACDDQEQIRPPPEASTGDTTACDLSETSFEAQPLARPLPGHICSKRSSGYSQLRSFVRQAKAKARSRLAVLFRVLVARSCAMQPQTRRSPAPPSSSSSPPASLRPARPLLVIPGSTW